jgi:exodeoxyribonuclease VII small subunit
MHTEQNCEKQIKKQDLSFEEAIKELEFIVQKLEGGNIPLDTVIEYYNRGNFLRKYCEEKLSEAKLKIEKVVVEEGNAIKLEPMKFEE